jgi:uncharacterized protein (TIGR00255 family)
MSEANIQTRSHGPPEPQLLLDQIESETHIAKLREIVEKSKVHWEEAIQIVKNLEKNGLIYKSSRKLNFISQEIGREINTIGSKANDAQMQKLVVVMKDELEKIKEQANNVL